MVSSNIKTKQKLFRSLFFGSIRDRAFFIELFFVGTTNRTGDFVRPVLIKDKLNIGKSKNPFVDWLADKKS